VRACNSRAALPSILLAILGWAAAPAPPHLLLHHAQVEVESLRGLIFCHLGLPRRYVQRVRRAFSLLIEIILSSVKKPFYISMEAGADAVVNALLAPEDAELIVNLSAEERAKYDYLKAQVMPTLSASLQALLRERERRAPGTGAVELVKLNALDFLAQHLMRHNPNILPNAQP
jgi:hypothetical protein